MVGYYIFGLTGSSGGGKVASSKNHHSIRSKDLFSYNINKHRHLGEIFQSGDLLKASKEELRKYRKHVQMIFQNPRSSLNLNMPVPDILAEAIKINEPNIINKIMDNIQN